MKMNIYERKIRWKLWLLLAAIVIVSASLFYTNILAKKLAEEERKKVQLWANATKQIVNLPENSGDLSFLLEVIENNKSVPVILTDDKDNIISYRNLDSSRVANNPDYLKKELSFMRKVREPIEINFAQNQKNYIYYKDSYLLRQLRFYPFIQFGIIGIFLIVAYLAMSISRKAEQNQVWVGMAKETAHQLGTPLSSLSGWVEHLKEMKKNESEASIVSEIEKDVERLEVITDRFSKIGSEPSLTRENIKDEITGTVNYIRTRASDKVNFSVTGGENILAGVNPPLFDWVIENLLKNALDAMEGNGKVEIKITQHKNEVLIDVSDTGKGIPRAKFKTVFKPGYSTKKRGWGLGLSLSKRIIEEYHDGKIFVKESAAGKGATFRIVLRVGNS